MLKIGYHASHEQFSPSDLLHYAQIAAKSGFDLITCSDHFHPWSEIESHSGFAWSWLGAAMQAIHLEFGIVTSPAPRYHPAIIAQAVATLNHMFDNRLWIAAGSGQAMNENITGESWPDKQTRNHRLQESVSIMRRLWEGQEVTQYGHINVIQARLYTLPPASPKVFGAALSKETAAWLASWSDGLITIHHPQEKLQKLTAAYRAVNPAGQLTIKSQLQDYATVDFLRDHVSKTRAFKNHFSAVLHSKKIIHAKKLLLACGIKDKLPPIDGFQSCWGVSIIDCPYCHGYEFRDKRAIVLGSLRKAKKMVTLLRSLHTEISIIDPSEPQKNRNKEIQGSDNFEIDNSYSTIKSIQHKNGLVHSIHLQHGQSQLVDIIYAPRPFKLMGDLHVQLGCKQTKHGYIRVNKKQQTSVHNVYACGDNSNLLRSISSAVYSGTKAGMTINKALAKESRSGKT